MTQLIKIFSVTLIGSWVLDRNRLSCLTVSMAKWNKQLPTKPGWYWVRNAAAGLDQKIVEVRDRGLSIGQPANGDLAVENTDLDDSRMYQTAEWSGPIPQPK